jgi:hypothetical protein
MVVGLGGDRIFCPTCLKRARDTVRIKEIPHDNPNGVHVPHERRVGKGNHFRVNQLTDPRDIYEMTAPGRKAQQAAEVAACNAVTTTPPAKPDGGAKKALVGGLDDVKGGRQE